jgi:FkbM family methyltransferase
MALSLEDRLKMLLPGALYYPRKIAKETAKREPELGLLDSLVQRGGAAIDVGCNRGIYSYQLSKLCERVIAFEPHPDMARFARACLPGNTTVIEAAAGAEAGRAMLSFPADHGVSGHMFGGIRTPQPGEVAIEVEVRTIDGLDASDVRFIKVDAEGGETAVLKGAAETIRRCRPAMLIELLEGFYLNPIARIEEICVEFGYFAYLIDADGGLTDARTLLASGSSTRSGNVVFKPRTA